MGAKTKIEWTDSTWNPITGCTKISEGCEHCYAHNLARRFPQIHGFSENDELHGEPVDFGAVQFHPERLLQPLHWKKPRDVFVCSMGDIFHPAVLKEDRDEVFKVMAQAQEHRFMLLTKRPEVAKEYLGALPKELVSYSSSVIDAGTWFKLTWRWPLPNVWLGVTAENQQRADERIPILISIPAVGRFVSIEPMLGNVDLERPCGQGVGDLLIENLNWVIIGAETGHGARPLNFDNARKIRDQCAAAGVPFFLKKLNARGDRLLDGVEHNARPLRQGGYSDGQEKT